jgi:hypothetical protein
MERVAISKSIFLLHCSNDGWSGGRFSDIGYWDIREGCHDEMGLFIW